MYQYKFFLLGLLQFLLVPQALGQALDDDLQAAYDNIKPDMVYGYCKALCDPAHDGRQTGSPGFTSAARWAASKFRKWGLGAPAHYVDHLMAFPAPYSTIERARLTFLLPGAGEGKTELELKPGTDFLPLLFSDSGDHTAGVVFAGWGISAPEIGYDDYVGIDVASKFVLCYRGVPDRSDNRFNEHDYHRHRMHVASKKGARGVFYIYDRVSANPNGDRIKGFMPVSISSLNADRLLKTRGLTSAELKQRLQDTKKPDSFLLESKIHLQVQARYFPDGEGYNVVGYLPGADEGLKNECVVVGAHMDHCGRHMGLLFNGAQDNASGSAAVLSIGEAFSRLSKRPRRSVIFVLFGGEETGLLGSTHFVRNLPQPFTEVTGMFNLDMVGEGDGVNMAYGVDSSWLKDFVERANQTVGSLRGIREIKKVGVRSSDQAPFALSGVPWAAFGSNGPHHAYHQTGDTIYRINPDMLADVSRLVFLSVYYAANR